MFAVERTTYQDAAGVEKVNLVAELPPTVAPDGGRGPGADGRPGLAWFGHTDVVPAGRWTGPGGPFTPAVTGGRLYGRGSCDMKGPVACALAAAARLVASGVPRVAPLWVVLTADEEVGFDGARELVRSSAAYRKLAAAGPPGVIGEPTGLRVVHAHKGSLRLRATARGEAAHSSTGRGENAVLKLVPFLADLRKLIEEVAADPTLGDPEFAPPGPSWNLTISDGGTAMNVVPDEATATVYARPVPGTDDAAAVARFRGLAERHGLEAEVRRQSGGFRTDPHAPFPQAVRELTGGGDPQTVCYGTDAGVFAHPPAGTAPGLEHLIVCGPGHIAQAHTAAEYIELARLERGAEVYEEVFRRWCVRT